MEKTTLKSSAEKMGLTSSKIIIGQFIFMMGVLVAWITNETLNNRSLEEQLNKVESCIKWQEKYRENLEVINIKDLKSCVSNSRKLTKNELDNILKI